MPGTEKVLGEALSLGLSPHSKVSAWRTGHAIFISLSRAPGMRSGDRKAGQQPGGAATPPTFPELGPKQRGQAHPGHMVGLHTSLCFIPQPSALLSLQTLTKHGPPHVHATGPSVPWTRPQNLVPKDPRALVLGRESRFPDSAPPSHAGEDHASLWGHSKAASSRKLMRRVLQSSGQ